MRVKNHQMPPMIRVERALGISSDPEQENEHIIQHACWLSKFLLTFSFFNPTRLWGHKTKLDRIENSCWNVAFWHWLQWCPHTFWSHSVYKVLFASRFKYTEKSNQHRVDWEWTAQNVPERWQKSSWQSHFSNLDGFVSLFCLRVSGLQRCFWTFIYHCSVCELWRKCWSHDKQIRAWQTAKLNICLSPWRRRSC